MAALYLYAKENLTKTKVSCLMKQGDIFISCHSSLIIKGRKVFSLPYVEPLLRLQCKMGWIEVCHTLIFHYDPQEGSVDF